MPRIHPSAFFLVERWQPTGVTPRSTYQFRVAEFEVLRPFSPSPLSPNRSVLSLTFSGGLSRDSRFSLGKSASAIEDAP